MGKVIGALAGLVATAVFAVAAAELLGGETGVDLLAGLKRFLPADALTWLARAPIASPEGAPMWRAPIIGVAIAAGAAGGLLLLVTARLSAVLLWLSFLLLLGVLVGQDLAVTGAWSGVLDADWRPDLIARGGLLGASFLFALIANAVTGTPKRQEPEVVHADLRERAVDLRERLRAEAPRLDESPPARRARPPEPAPSSSSEPPPEPLSESASHLPSEPQPQRDAGRERDLDRTREPPDDAAGSPRPAAQAERRRDERSRSEASRDDERPKGEHLEDEDLVPEKG